MVKRSLASAALVALALLSFSHGASAVTLELALVIDGSGSISGPNGSLTNPSNKTTPPDYGDWGLQLDAYRNVFQNNFYSNVVGPSNVDTVVAAAIIFSGGASFSIDPGTPNDPSDDIVTEYSVFSFIDWTEINDDASAATFGSQFDKTVIPHPGGTTATSEALDVALGLGGPSLIGCPDPNSCNPVAPLQPPFQSSFAGLLSNNFDGDFLVIDISTDGDPTEPNSNGNRENPPSAANMMDDALAIASADTARANGVTVNAIGVGPDVNLDLLEALVGFDPMAGQNAGFVVTADSFMQFEATLQNKVETEISNIPIPATLPLFLSGLFGWGIWQRRQRTQS